MAANPQLSKRAAALSNTQIAGGYQHSLAVRTGGAVWAWGDNALGELGNGSTSNASTPKQVCAATGCLKGKLSGITAVAASPDAEVSIALAANGTVWAWGDNSSGQLGNDTTTNSTLPVQVCAPSGCPTPLSGMTAVAVGGSHVLALKSDGTVWSWGANDVGQLGIGTTAPSLLPVQVPGLAGMTVIAAGGKHSLALAPDGTVRAWGWNASGQLGDGTHNDALSPLTVAGLSGVTAVAAGAFHSLALTSDGMAHSWGRNVDGQLGVDADIADHPTPQTITTLSAVTAIAAGDSHSLAVTVDGQAWGWGYGDDGELGAGSPDHHVTPVPMVGLSYAATVAGGWAHSLLTTGDGTIWATGSNASGQLGTGGADSEVPVSVPMFTPPLPARLVTAKVTGATSIHVTWLPPTNAQPGINYTVTLHNPDGTTVGVPGTCGLCSSGDFVSLTTGHPYFATVSASNNGSASSTADSNTAIPAVPAGVSWDDSQPSTSSGLVFHAGGIVVHHPRVYLVFWGPGSDPNLEQPLQDFFNGLAHTSWNQLLTQYHDGSDWVHDDVRVAEGDAGVWVDTGSSPPRGGALFSDLVNEAARATTINGWNASPDTIFTILLPPGAHYAQDVSACGFHVQGVSGGVTYTVATSGYLDTSYDNGGPCSNAAPTSAAMDNITVVVSHEYAEAVTDPGANNLVSYNWGTAWWNGKKGEIADLCQPPAQPVVRLGGTGPYVQQLWDNATDACQSGATISQPSTSWNDGSADVGARTARIDGADAQAPDADGPLQSVLASIATHPSGTAQTTAVPPIVLAANPFDAASGAGLATREGGFELIQDASCANPDVQSELDRVAGDAVPTIYLSGGPACLADRAGFNVVTLYGADACDTSALDATQLLADYKIPDVIVVSGDENPDLGTATALAAARGWPVLVAEPGAAGAASTALCGRANAVLASLGAGAQVHVIGNDSAIDPALVSAIAAQTCSTCVDRQGQDAGDAWAVSAAVATQFAGPGTVQVTLASEHNWSDAVAAATLGAANGDPLLLIDSSYATAAATAWEAANTVPGTLAWAVGGTHFTFPSTLASAAGALTPVLFAHPGGITNPQPAPSPAGITVTWWASIPGSSPIDDYFVAVVDAGNQQRIGAATFCGTCTQASFNLAAGRAVQVWVFAFNQYTGIGWGQESTVVTSG